MNMVNIMPIFLAHEHSTSDLVPNKELHANLKYFRDTYG